MKKTTLLTVLFFLLRLSVFSQAEVKQTVIQFRPHWSLQVQGGIGYTLGELKFGKLISPSAAFAAGYRFTPVWGVRFGVGGWQSKGGWASPEESYKYKYLQVNADALLNLSNWWGGYRHDRFFSSYLSGGIGYNYGFDNDEAVALNDAGHTLRYLWRDTRSFVAGRLGLGADFRLSDAVAFNLEGNANVLSDHYNAKKAGNADWHFNIMAGFTFRLGKGYTKKEKTISRETTPALPVTTTPTRQSEPVKEKTAEVPVKTEKTEPTRENIFFALNSSELQDSEESKINTLVTYLQKHTDSRIVLTGYADKQTGNPRINSRLSQQRAQKVADALIAAGIAASRITVDYKGDTVQPFDTPEKNRVTVCITESK